MIEDINDQITVEDQMMCDLNERLNTSDNLGRTMSKFRL